MSAPPLKLNSLLKDVSRSFYLTMRVLPGAIRPQIALAYLLARATDTIADTQIVPVNQRLQALQSLRNRIRELKRAPLDLRQFVRSPWVGSNAISLKPPEDALRNKELKDAAKVRVEGSDAERNLLERIEEILAVLATFSPTDRTLIREVLSTITSGQELDLNRFADAGPDKIVSLKSEDDLDDYTWRVAGCVGEFWTKMCRAHLFPDAPLDEARLLANGIRFGKGLQLVNILRDLPADIRQGRCYLPATQLSEHRLAPVDLLQAANELKFRPLYGTHLDKAQEHLSAGWDYTNALPRRCVRVRLACAWPILIGMKTLARLRTQNVLDPQNRIKISRAEVRGVMARSVISYAWPAAWQGMFERSTVP